MKNKKKLTAKQKKIIDITVICVQVAVVIVAIVISIIVIANPLTQSAQVTDAKTKLLPVLTDSMVGPHKDSFNPGDLVIAKTPKDPLALEENDIITYVGSVAGFEALITHRIVEVVKDDNGNTLFYYTLGDAQPRDSEVTVLTPYEVLAVYSFHIKGIGKAINWLQKDTNFLLTIVIPLVVLFVYNIIMFVRMIMQSKIEQAKEDTAAASIDAEEIKRRAIEEYLAKQNMAADTAESAAVTNEAEPTATTQPTEEETTE